MAQLGVEGQWDFKRPSMWRTIQAAGASPDRSIQKHICRHLASLPASDSMRQPELMYHFVGAHDAQGAARFYGGGDLSEPELAGAAAALAEHATAGQAAWVTSLVHVNPSTSACAVSCARGSFVRSTKRSSTCLPRLPCD